MGERPMCEWCEPRPRARPLLCSRQPNRWSTVKGREGCRPGSPRRIADAQACGRVVCAHRDSGRAATCRKCAPPPGPLRFEAQRIYPMAPAGSPALLRHGGSESDSEYAPAPPPAGYQSQLGPRGRAPSGGVGPVIGALNSGNVSLSSQGRTEITDVLKKQLSAIRETADPTGTGTKARKWDKLRSSPFTLIILFKSSRYCTRTNGLYHLNRIVKVVKVS